MIVTAFLVAGWSFLVGALSWPLIVAALERRGLTRINYRGHAVPTAAGLVILPSVFPLAVLLVYGGYPAEGLGLLAATWGLGVAGLIDDLSGEEPSARGWRGHLGSMFRLRITGGGKKLLVGGGSALAAALVTGPSLPVAIAGAVLIGLSANTVNQLDLRPGRAWKAFLLAAWLPPLAAGQVPGFLAASAAAGTAAAVMGPELDERMMLGDAGANALGGLLGYILLISLSLAWMIVALIALGAGQLYTETRSLGGIIRSNRWLRRLDDWGLRTVQ